MAYDVIRPDQLAFAERPYRPQDPARAHADLSGPLGLVTTRAQVWTYPPGSRGRHHRELVQEEVIAVLAGTLTLVLAGGAARHALPAGSFARLGVGEAFQLRNEGDAELRLLIWGAPPEDAGRQAEILEDLP